MSNTTPAGDKINEWNQTHGFGDDDIQLIRQLKARGFGGETLATILDVLEGVCSHCFDGDSGCACWNDE